MIYQSEENPAPSMGENAQKHTERDARDGECLERLCESNEPTSTSHRPDSLDVKEQVGHCLQGHSFEAYTFTSWLREPLIKFSLALKSRDKLYLVLAIIFAVVFLMQVYLNKDC